MIASHPYRVIFDANWYVSASISERSRRSLFRILNDPRFSIIISAHLLFEYDDVIGRRNMRRYISPEQADRFKRWAREKTVMFVPWSTVTVCRDPDDDYLLALAKDCEANFLISGDPDLQTVKRFGITEIVTMREFNDLFFPL